MLKSEGFTETDFVDIFDAGPMIHCETQQIKAVQRSQEVIVTRVVDADRSALNKTDSGQQCRRIHQRADRRAARWRFDRDQQCRREAT